MDALKLDQLAPEHSWAKSPIAAWLADHNGGRVTANELFQGFCDRLAEDGIPLYRVSLNVRDSHPQIAGRAIFWVREQGIEQIAYDYARRDSPEYLDSPIKVIHDGAGGLRRRLMGPKANLDFPVLQELRDGGSADFVAMPIVFSDGTRHYISLTTDRYDGFTEAELTRLYDLLPLFSLRIELEHARHTSRTLMQTYLGQQAARRVIGGEIRRGGGESIEAIVLFCDLRGFTNLVARHTPTEVTDTLSLYYEALAGPVEEFGGDIVKMMGDGLLAIFPVTDAAGDFCIDKAGCSAVTAVRKAIDNLRNIDPMLLPEGVDRLRAGFALHFGEITFGNIGSLDRLDFTVIGPAVNEAVRAEQLTKKLNLPLVATQSFANLDCSVEMRSLGAHALRGVPQPVELFTPTTGFGTLMDD